MKQYQDLIDRLANKTLSFGCIVEKQMCGDPYFGNERVKIRILSNKNNYFTGVILSAPVENIEEYKDRKTGEYSLMTKEVDIVGHPILIGDVLEKMKHLGYEYVVAPDGHFLEKKTDTEDGLLVYEGTGVYWNPITRSLQEILEEEVEEGSECIHCGQNWDEKGACECHTGMFENREPEFKKQLKPEAKALFDFLIEIL